MTEPAATNEFDEFRETAVFRLVCSVMAIDGKATKSERDCIKQVVRDAGFNWTPQAVEQGIDQFIEDIKNQGFSNVLATALNRVHSLRQPKWRDLVLNCMDTIARADGAVADHERQLCDRIRQLVS
ncbi:MAG: TerB family tellurite resistance protein [Planctomycetes bacterium]|nr:TerB family tellurite resistance protein [Planctomycetota bacterium]